MAQVFVPDLHQDVFRILRGDGQASRRSICGMRYLVHAACLATDADAATALDILLSGCSADVGVEEELVHAMAY